jgi:hypothetical protein
MLYTSFPTFFLIIILNCLIFVMQSKSWVEATNLTDFTALEVCLDIFNALFVNVGDWQRFEIVFLGLFAHWIILLNHPKKRID